MSLFSKILSMTIVSSIICLAVCATRYLIRNRILPKYRYLIWSIFIVSLIFPIRSLGEFNIYEIVKIEKVAKNIDYFSYEDVQFVKDKNNILNENIVSNNKKLHNNHMIVIEIVILFLSISLAIFKLSTYIYFQKSLKSIQTNNNRILAILEKCKETLNIRKKIDIVINSRLQTASIIGIFRVKILLPEYIFELDDEEITNIILHELAHYKRKDNVVIFILHVLLAIYWFNPVMYIALRKIKNDMELATDELVISKLDNLETANYCKTLIGVAKIVSNKHPAGAFLGFVTKKEILEERIDMISKRDRISKYSKIMFSLIITIILLIWLTLCPAYVSAKEDDPKLYITVNNSNSKFEINSNSIKTMKIKTTDELEFYLSEDEEITYLIYSKTDLADKKQMGEIVNAKSNKISLFDKGEYLYKFSLKYNDRKVDYKVKIKVE